MSQVHISLDKTCGFTSFKYELFKLYSNMNIQKNTTNLNI